MNITLLKFVHPASKAQSYVLWDPDKIHLLRVQYQLRNPILLEDVPTTSVVQYGTVTLMLPVTWYTWLYTRSTAWIGQKSFLSKLPQPEVARDPFRGEH